MTKVLFSRPEGPRLRYAKGFLIFADEPNRATTEWRVSRGELWNLGWRCMWTALRGEPVRHSVKHHHHKHHEHEHHERQEARELHQPPHNHKQDPRP